MTTNTSPLRLMMEGHGIDVECSLRTARDLLSFAVERCVCCSRYDTCARDTAAHREVCPNAVLFAHLPRSADPPRLAR